MPALRAAVTGYLRTVADEVAADGITVNTACPGYTATERLDELAVAVAAAWRPAPLPAACRPILDATPDSREESRIRLQAAGRWTGIPAPGRRPQPPAARSLIALGSTVGLGLSHDRTGWDADLEIGATARRPIPDVFRDSREESGIRQQGAGPWAGIPAPGAVPGRLLRDPGFGWGPLEGSASRASGAAGMPIWRSALLPAARSWMGSVTWGGNR